MIANQLVSLLPATVLAGWAAAAVFRAALREEPSIARPLFGLSFVFGVLAATYVAQAARLDMATVLDVRRAGGFVLFAAGIRLARALRRRAQRVRAVIAEVRPNG